MNNIHNNNSNNSNINFHCAITKDDEVNMIFLGFLVFVDPIKDDVVNQY